MRKHNKLLAMVMALAMVLAFMPALAFAEEGEEAEILAPAAPERIQTDSQDVSYSDVVGISFLPNPITVWGPSITVLDENGSPYYDINARYLWTHPDGSTDWYSFAPGDELKVTYKDGRVVSCPYLEVYYEGYYGWFTDGENYFFPEVIPDAGKLVPGNNVATLIDYRTDCKTSVTIFVDTPELLAQREEAARQGVPDGSIPKVKTSKLSTGKKSITVKWKKLTKKQLKKSKATHYEVWVCANTGFAKGETSEHLIKKSKSGVKIKKVPKGTYYVMVRAIKKDANGTKHVGPWTKPKKVKVKK